MADATLRMVLLGEDRTASRALQGVGSTAQHTSGLVVAAGKAAGLGVLGLGAFAAAGIKMGVETAAANQQAQISFTSLLGSGDKAQAFLKDLTNFAAVTPFDLPGVEKAAQQLLGVGQSSQQVIPFLTAFGNTASALGLQTDQFNAVMTQTTQAVANGKFQIGDLSALASNGIPVYKLLGEAFGKTSAQIAEMATKGQLTSDVVLPALQRQMNKDYGGAMEKQSQSLTGLWSTLKDTLSQALAKGIAPLIPILGKVMPQAISAISVVIPLLGRAFAGLVLGISKVVGGIKDFVGGFRFGTDAIGSSQSVFAQWGAVVYTMWTNHVKPALDGIVAGATAVVGFIVQHWPQIQAAFVTMWQNVKPVVDSFMQLLATLWVSVLAPIAGWIQAHWPQIELVIKGVFIAVAVAAKILLLALQGAFTIIRGAILLLSASFRVEFSIISSIVRGLIGTVSSVVGTVKGTFNGFVGFVSAIPGRISAFGGAMLNAGSHLMNSLFNGIKDVLSGVGGFAANIGQSIVNAVNDLLHLPLTIPEVRIGAFGHYVTIGGETLIPRLATGGVVTRATTALIGEAGPEAIIPLNRAKQYGFGAGGGGPVTLNVYAGIGTNGQSVGAQIRQELLREQRVIGGSLGFK